LCGADGVVELFHGAGADDGGGDGGLMQEPGEGDYAGGFAEFAAEGLVGFELCLMGFDFLFEPFAAAASALMSLQCAAEHPAVERTPGNETESVAFAGGNDFEFDVAVGEVVDGACPKNGIIRSKIYMLYT
jgi:hypothetical protein